MESLFEKTLDYLKEIIPNFSNNGKTFICPKCGKSSCTIIPASNILYCIFCKRLGDIADIVKYAEKDKENYTREESIKYLKNHFNLNFNTPDEIDEVLQFYKDNNFDLVPVIANGKIPVESNWTNKNHKDIKEWKRWLSEGLNIGIKTGKISNVTVIDIDAKLPDEVSVLLNKTLFQKTTKKDGMHLFYQYEEDLPKTRIGKYGLDLENDGGQVVCYPSVVEEVNRKIELYPIEKMNPEFKDWLKKQIGGSSQETAEEEYKPGSGLCKFNLVKNGEGRNNFLIRMGGIVRNHFNLSDTKKMIRILNNCLCDPPIPEAGVTATVIKGIEKYYKADENEVAKKILNYIETVEECTSRDIREALGYGKEQIDTILSYLIKEEYIIKKRRLFKILKKVNWKVTFLDEGREIEYKMPYFDSYAVFRSGDMIVLGAQTGVGKCITNGLLLTNQGFLRIEDIGKNRKCGWTKVSRHIRIHTGRPHEEIYRVPNGFYKEKVNNTIKIKTYFGFEIEGTPEHPVLIKETIKTPTTTITRKVFKKLKDLKVGDEMILSCPKAEKRKNIKKEKIFKYKIKKHATNLKDIIIPEKITPNIARLMGFIIGDGTFQKYSFAICQDKKEKKNISEIVSLIEEFGISPKIIYDEEGHNGVDIKCISDVMCSFLRKKLFNTNKKINILSPNRKIPDCILKSNKDIILSFISGIFDSEGYSNENGNFGITMASKDIIDTIHLILLNYGVVARKTIKKVKKYPDNTYYSLNFSQEMTFELSKILKLNKLEGKKLVRNNRTFYLRSFWNNQFGKSGYYVDKIIEKKEFNDEKYVYDFNIENKKYKHNHLFWCNGFVNHNSHCAMNIVKGLVDQDIVPHYISLESGARFINVAKRLGLKEGDFKWDINYSPEDIEIEDDSITIVDWLLPDDYSATDKIFKRLSEQLVRKGGILIVFVQLKKDGTFFAENMLEMFPALVAKFEYTGSREDKDYGIYSKFVITKMREAKFHTKGAVIPCKYDVNSKRLIPVSEENNDG